MTAVDGKATAYVCRDFRCEQPLTDPGSLAAMLAPDTRDTTTDTKDTKGAKDITEAKDTTGTRT